MTEDRPAQPTRWFERPTFRHAAVVIAIAVTMASVFAVSYSLALARPTPHHIPAGIVGERAAAPAAIAALERATHGGLAFRPYPSAPAAERAIDEQTIYAALLTGAHPRLLVASASGTSVARLLEQAAASAGPLTVVDLHPLPSKDPQGLVSFYVTLAATLLGFVTMFQLRANAAELSLRAWLACIGVLAVAGGFALAFVTDVLLGALRGSFADLWAALAAQISVAALFNSTMLTLIGRWAIVVTWGFFVAVGNAASGGAVAPPLLPGFYGFISRYVPTGATIQTIRNAVYFPHAQHLGPIIVEAAWIACMLTALVVAARTLGRTPSSG